MSKVNQNEKIIIVQKKLTSLSRPKFLHISIGMSTKARPNRIDDLCLGQIIPRTVVHNHCEEEEEGEGEGGLGEEEEEEEEEEEAEEERTESCH